MAVDVAVPLVAVGAVLVAFVLDDQLVRHVDQVNPADRALVIADDQVAFRQGQPGEDQAQPEPGFARRVHPFSYQPHRGPGGDDAAS